MSFVQELGVWRYSANDTLYGLRETRKVAPSFSDSLVTVYSVSYGLRALLIPLREDIPNKA